MSLLVDGRTQFGFGSHPSGSFVPEAVTASLSFLRSDKQVFTTMLIRPVTDCQPTSKMAGPNFSYLRNPKPSFPGGLHNFYGRIYAGGSTYMGDFQILGIWTRLDRQLHISCLELKAVIVALHHWVSALQGHQVLIAMDNTTVVDCLSRQNQLISTEWSLHSEIVNRIFKAWGSPAVDMFATVHNTHLSQFMSLIPEPLALALDALPQDWQGRSMYMFPSFPLLNKVIQKLCAIQEANTAMVSTPTSILCGSPSVLSIPQSPAVTAGTEVHLRRKVIPYARKEALMQQYKATGFSDEVSRLAAAPRRPSTNRMYDDRWLPFTLWAAREGFDPSSPTAVQIAAFLYSLFDTRGLSSQTNKDYRTCLGSVLNRTGKAKVILH